MDINQLFLDECLQRYHLAIPSLHLLKLDLAKHSPIICKADFVWAALVLEYIGIDQTLQFSKLNMVEGGHLVITIQQNNHMSSVSKTTIKTIAKVEPIFKAVETGLLIEQATALGFAYISSEESKLPNGKCFLTIDFCLY